MNGPDSISDPVARRLCCTESYPSARGSARLKNGSAQLGLARLAADDVAGGSHCADVSADWSMMWLLTWHAYCARLHQADVIPGMPTVHADVTITSC
jgi:hypothetical protein